MSFGVVPRLSSPIASNVTSVPLTVCSPREVPFTKSRARVPVGAFVDTVTFVSNVSPHAMPSRSSLGPSVTLVAPPVGASGDTKLTSIPGQPSMSLSVTVTLADLTPVRVRASSSTEPLMPGIVTPSNVAVPSAASFVEEAAVAPEFKNRSRSCPELSPSDAIFTSIWIPSVAESVSSARVIV